jgi:hypothetical protein
MQFNSHSLKFVQVSHSLSHRVSANVNREYVKAYRGKWNGATTSFTIHFVNESFCFCFDISLSFLLQLFGDNFCFFWKFKFIWMKIIQKTKLNDFHVENCIDQVTD